MIHLKKSKKRIYLLSGIALICFVFAIYLAFSLFFIGHYYPGTQIGEVDCGLRTVAEAQHLITEKAGQYALHLSGREGTEAILTAQDLGIVFLPDDELEELSKKQNGFGWPSFLWKRDAYEVPVSVAYAEEALEERLSDVMLFQKKLMRAPKDAFIGEYDTESGRYPIIAEDEGTLIDLEKAKEVIILAVEAMQEELSLEEAGCYVEPSIKSDDKALNAFCDKLNQYVAARVEYDWHGIPELVDGNLIKDWLEIDWQKQTVELKEDAVRDYINALSRKNDSYGKPRKFRTSKNHEIYVKPGNYGWRIDRDKEAKALTAIIRRGEQLYKEPEYFYTAAARGPDDIGSSYVEIDLTAQHLYLYVDGRLITESDFVSGNVSRGHTTPEGVFGLTYKTRNATLRGRGYATPVSYWMPFNGNIGMHDAAWRSKFGGDIYLKNGSHGCINLPVKEAEKIYEHVSTGFPVICYNDEAEKEEQEEAQNTVEAQPADNTQTEGAAENVDTEAEQEIPAEAPAADAAPEEANDAPAQQIAEEVQE